jgi:hypothetical protein
MCTNEYCTAGTYFAIVNFPVRACSGVNLLGYVSPTRTCLQYATLSFIRIFYASSALPCTGCPGYVIGPPKWEHLDAGAKTACPLFYTLARSVLIILINEVWIGCGIDQL